MENNDRRLIYITHTQCNSDKVKRKQFCPDKEVVSRFGQAVRR